MELMVVFAIMAIMTAISIAMTSNNKERKDLEIAAREVAQSIRQMQNNALTGKLPTTSSSAYACGYVFVLGIVNGGASNQYRSGYVSKSVPADCSSSTANISSLNLVTLKSGINFSGSSPQAFYFNLPRGVIFYKNTYDDSVHQFDLSVGNEMASGDKQTITLEPSTGDLRADICVYASGKIQEGSIRKTADTPDC